MCCIILLTAPCRRGSFRILLVHNAPKEDGGEQERLTSAGRCLNHKPQWLVSLELLNNVRLHAILIGHAITSCSLLHHFHTLFQ